MTSPVTDLLNAIAASPFRVAPEATADLDELLTSRSLALEFCPDKRLFAELLVSRNLIRLGVPFLEVLWAAAHAYIVIFHECQQANKRGEATFAVGERSRTAMAYKLYRDLLQAMQQEVRSSGHRTRFVLYVTHRKAQIPILPTSSSLWQSLGSSITR
jgi:hypothetical protein